VTRLADARIDKELMSNDFLRDPYPLMARLRDENPVYWSESMGAWVLTRYDDIAVTFRDFANYSNEDRHAAPVEYLPPERRREFELLEAHFRAGGLPDVDPPRHSGMRKSALQCFNPRMAPPLRPRVQQILDGLLDQVEPSGGMDVIADVGLILPAVVISELLGVPTADLADFTTWARETVTYYGVNKPSEQILARSQAGLTSLRDYLTAIIDDRRRRPGDDVISTLLASPHGTFNDEELLATCVTFMIGGHTTTTALIGNGLFTLLKHPAQWDELARDRTLIPNAIEEILRYESPVARQPRELHNNVVLNGQELETGDVVFQMLGAANRDPEHFTAPDTFDIHRSPNRHLAFGLAAHFCIGAPLSRLEGVVFFDTILTRFPNIRLRDDTPHWDMNFPNGRLLERLEVEFA
jgi:cytochrome P450